MLLGALIFIFISCKKVPTLCFPWFLFSLKLLYSFLFSLFLSPSLHPFLPPLYLSPHLALKYLVQIMNYFSNIIELSSSSCISKSIILNYSVPKDLWCYLCPYINICVSGILIAHISLTANFTAKYFIWDMCPTISVV